MLSGRSLLAGLVVMWGTWSVAVAAVYPQAVPPVSGARGRGAVLGPVVRTGMMDEMTSMSAGMFGEEIEGMEEVMPSASPEMEMEMETATPEAELFDKAGERMYEETMYEMEPSPSIEYMEGMYPSPSMEYVEEMWPTPSEEYVY